MKRVLAFLLAFALVLTLGCSSLNLAPNVTLTASPTASPTPSPTPEPTPSPTPAPPEGLSSQPFDFLENTYALWRIIRHTPVDGKIQYDVQLVATGTKIYCSITIENNEATAIYPSYTLKLLTSNGESLSSVGSAILGTADITDFASSFDSSSDFKQAKYVLNYTFELPETDALPTRAELSYATENALATIEFTNPIVIDAES